MDGIKRQSQGGHIYKCEIINHFDWGYVYCRVPEHPRTSVTVADAVVDVDDLWCSWASTCVIVTYHPRSSGRGG